MQFWVFFHKIGQFWNLHNQKISKLSLDAHFDPQLYEKIDFEVEYALKVFSVKYALLKTPMTTYVGPSGNLTMFIRKPINLTDPKKVEKWLSYDHLK